MHDSELDALLGREIARLRKRIVETDSPSPADVEAYRRLLDVRQRLEHQSIDPQTLAALVGPRADDDEIAAPRPQAGLAKTDQTRKEQQPVSREYLEVAGESVALYEADGFSSRPRRERQVRLPDFLARLHRQVTTETPLLPEGARWYRRAENREVVVIETPPQLRTIRYAGPEGPARTVPLAFPYLVYCAVADYGVLRNQRSRLYVRTAPLAREQDELSLLPLAHVKGFDRNSDVPPGTICFLAEGEKDIREGPLAENVAALLHRFWDTTFESWMWGEGAQQTADKRLRSLDAWAEASADDPLFVLTAAWPDAKTTLTAAVEGLLVAGGARQSPKTFGELVDLVYQLPEVNA